MDDPNHHQLHAYPPVPWAAPDVILGRGSSHRHLPSQYHSHHHPIHAHTTPKHEGEGLQIGALEGDCAVQRRKVVGALLCCAKEESCAKEERVICAVQRRVVCDKEYS
ncbi:hypothetical protein V2J09_004271 [Rumex salicifolius]